MDTTKTTQRSSTFRPPIDGKAGVRAQPNENQNPRKLNVALGVPTPGRIAVDTRVDAAKRQTSASNNPKGPLGPRPPEFAARRVISDAPPQMTTPPRRAQIPLNTSEPFLGLSARKRPAASTAVQSPVTRNKETNRSVRTEAVSNSSDAGGSAAQATKPRIGQDVRMKIPAVTGVALSQEGTRIIQSQGAEPSTRLVQNQPSRQSNPAVRAAQMSAYGTTNPATAPVTARSRQLQLQPLATPPEQYDEPPPVRLSGVDQRLAASAAKDSLQNAERRNTPTTSPLISFPDTLRATGPLRLNASSPFLDLPFLSGKQSYRTQNESANAEAATSQPRQHFAAHRIDSLGSGATETVVRASGSSKPKLVDIQSSLTTKRQSLPPNYSNNIGLLARTVSPTDIRRTKRIPEADQAAPIESGAGTSTADFASSNTTPVMSPYLPPRRKSSSPSSTRISPDPTQGFSADLSLSSQSSYSSLRPSSSNMQNRAFSGAQVSRNSSIRSRTTLSSVGDASEFVPPVPAIPRAYGSPRNAPDDQHLASFDDAVLQTIPSSEEMPSHVASAITSSAYDARHKRGFTLGSGLDGTNYPFIENGNTRQSTQPARLPPLNVLPLSKPTAAKIEALAMRHRDEGLDATTPPSFRMANRTPTTPLTASRATFSTSDLRLMNNMAAMPATSSKVGYRNISVQSSAGSSSTVFMTPSPAGSPRPPSEGISSPLPSFPDFEQQAFREKQRNEMLDAQRFVEETKSPATVEAHVDKNARTLPLSTLRGESAVTPTSPGPRNFSQKLQQLRDEMSTQKQELANNVAAATSSGLRRAVSMSKVKPQQPQDSPGAGGSQAVEPTVGVRMATSKAQLASNKVLNQAGTEAPPANGQIKPSARTATLPTPNQKSLTSRASAAPLKAQEGDALFDVDAFAADEEMRKLATSRKDFESAAKELDELKRRTTSKERLSPSQALRTENLNIFERGEIIDYKDIYFCGTKVAKKFVGDLTASSNNFGFDDDRGDYNLVIGDHLAYRYEVLDLLGKGSFGQVVRCIDHKTGALVAVKIIRNKKRFHQQALVEVNILRQLKEWDPQARHSMVVFTQSFYFRGHLCLATELLGMNLYEFIKAYDFRGFSLRLIRRFAKQMLSSLCLLQAHKVIHCDMKPENILLSHPLRSELKVIDFGSSCFENEKVYTYIQSRFYRSPEVILGMDYGLPIDMWSVGCILAELYTGYPIFPGENEQEQLACIMEIFGPPEKHLIEQCTRKKLFFDSLGKPRVTVSSKGKRRRPSSKTLSAAIKCEDEAFLDFLTRCLRWDPARRLKPDEAMNHDFLVGIKKRTHTPVLRAASTASPAKRFTIQATPARPRVLTEAPAMNARTGTATVGPGVNSPIKTAQPLRRHSTVAGSVLNNASKPRVVSGVPSAPAMPRVAQRNMSGKPDMASAAAAMASIQRQR